MPSVTADPSAWFDQTYGLEDSRLQLGTLPDMVVKSRNSHPYFQKSSWMKGDLIYRKAFFQGIDMMYNVERDVLIIKGADGETMNLEALELVSTEVESFNISGSEFRFLNQEVDAFTTGFLQVLYSGDHLELLAKRAKNYDINDESVLVYQTADRYYLKKANQFYRIRNLSAIKRLLKEQKKGINAFVKQNHIEILKPHTDDRFAMLIEYCDENLTQ